jgi:hypothetical protein
MRSMNVHEHLNYKGCVHDHSMSIRADESERLLTCRLSAVQEELASTRREYYKLQDKCTTLETEKHTLQTTSNAAK